MEITHFVCQSLQPRMVIVSIKLDYAYFEIYIKPVLIKIKFRTQENVGEENPLYLTLCINLSLSTNILWQHKNIV